jgi:ABC-type uncharacterized transport system substrate-binding protein
MDRRQARQAVAAPAGRSLSGAGLLVLATILGTTISGASARAAEVLAILSEDKVPFHQAEEGLAKSLIEAGHHLTTQVMDHLGDISELSHFAVLVSIGSKASTFLHQHLPAQVHLVYCMVADPIAAGLTTPPPVHGVATEVPLQKQVALIAEALPSARTVGMLYRGEQERSREQVEALRALLPSNWRLEAISIDESASVAEGIDNLLGKPIDVVWTSPDRSIYSEATVRTLLLSALRKRVPVFGFSTALVRAGGLLGIGINPLVQGSQSAAMVLSLLNGNEKDSAAVVSPTFDIEVNLVVAHKLAIDLPSDLLGRASHVYQAGR